MTELLRIAVQALVRLPQVEQDEIARRVIIELARAERELLAA